MKQDNRGFTLVELLISIVIFSIVAFAAFGFMTAGAKSFTNISTRIDRQLAAQIALSQLSDKLMNCNAGIAYSGDKLYILSKDSGGVLSATVYGPSGGDLNCGKASVTAVANASNTYTVAYSLSDRVASKIDGFSVALTSRVASDGISVDASSAEITLILKNDTRTYTQTVALRNAPAVVTVQ